jgi:hypothetical protein
MNLCKGELPYTAIKNLGRFLPQQKRRRERVQKEDVVMSLT